MEAYMNLETLAKAVTGFAPILGSSLLGPIGGVIGNLIANLFGGSTSNVDDLCSKISADPEAALKLKTLEFQHQDELAEINDKNYVAEVDDRKNARDMNEKLHDHMPNILAIAFLIIYALIQYMIVTHPSSSDDIISARVQDIFVMIISFYFGSAHRKLSNNTVPRRT